MKTPLASAVYKPQLLPVSDQEVKLTVPAGANAARVTVNTGAARIGLFDAPNAALYTAQQGEVFGGAQLGAVRLIRNGVTDASVRIDYWREG